MIKELRYSLQETRKEVANQARRILHLLATSSNAQDRDNRFAEGVYLDVHNVEEAFCSPAVYSQPDIDGCIAKKGRSPHEPGVQELFVELVPLLLPNSACWRDCHKAGIQFAGRRHDIDLVILSRNVLSMETVDTPIELKERVDTDACRRDVVLQLLDRIAYVFDAQLEREVCWGLAFDAQHVIFVKSKRDLSFSVTPSLEMYGAKGHLPLVARFLQAGSSARGFVNVVMPSLWGAPCESLLSQHEAFAVFALDGDRVAKVGRDRDSVQHERDLMQFVCDKAAGLVCPQLHPCDLNTGDLSWPYGFQMTRLNVLAVETEEDVVQVAAQAFWRLAVLHEIGVVHNDVKPSNMVTREKEAFLCDFGHAGKWRLGDNVLKTRGATKDFASIGGEFQLTSDNMFACDLEGLYWSILVLWLQVVEGRSTWKSLKSKDRQVLLLQLGFRGMIVEEGDSLKNVLPGHPALRKFFQEQANSRCLLSPRTQMDNYFKMIKTDETEEAWCAKVEEVEKAQSLLPCPRDVLKWFRAVCHAQ